MDYQEKMNYWKNKENQQMPKDQLIKRIEEPLKAHNTCALATGYADFVRCTPIEYTYLNQTFYFFSEGGLKYKALEKNKNACIAIYEPFGQGPLFGIQIMGKMEEIEFWSEEYQEIVNYKKYPQEQIKKLQMPLWKLVPEDIDYLDGTLKKENYNVRQHWEVRND